MLMWGKNTNKYGVTRKRENMKEIGRNRKYEREI
jgi:hypothetical protein